MSRGSVVCVLLFLLLSQVLYAQQVEQFSLIRETRYALNPAVTGTRGFIHGTLAVRKQFYGIKGSPYTIYAGAHGQFTRKTMGIGGYALHDVTGPTGKTAAGVSYAYHIRLDGRRNKPADATSHLLSFGAQVSLVQYRLDGDALQVNDANDPGLYKQGTFRLFPDASFGIWYQWKEFIYAGFSVPQILGLNIQYLSRNGSSEIRKVQHLYAVVGGKYEPVANRFSLEPLLALRWVRYAPLQFDVGLRAGIWNWVTIGCNYRSEGRLVMEGGVHWKDIVQLAYAYDYDLRPFGPEVGPSHELAVQFQLSRRRRAY